MWDPVTGGIHDTRDVTWMHRRMFYERKLGVSIVIPPMWIPGIDDETPTQSGEGKNDESFNEESKESIDVETVLHNDSELPTEGKANAMGNPTASAGRAT